MAALAGEQNWSCKVDGAVWEQPVNIYQAKTLRWVRDEYGKLNASDRDRVMAILRATDCEMLVENN